VALPKTNAMSDLRIVLWTGGNAPNRKAKLKVYRTGAPFAHERFAAYWEPGYCGCEDCKPLVGHGRTEEEAIADYWREWSER
jgi:hypothetical protein